MSDTFELEIKGLDELLAALERLGRDVEKELTPAVEKAMRHLWQELPSYPPKPQPGAASKYWTVKQRRWFFAALRDGRIQVPYKRQRARGLDGSLSMEVRSVAGEITGLMGPSMPYAPYVVGEGEQARIHQDRWWIFQNEIEKHLPGAIGILEEEVGKYLTELGGNAQCGDT